MSVSIELLDAFKSAMGGISDYASAPKLGVSQQMVSMIRKKRSNFSPEKALFICEMANLDGLDWLLRLYRERAKCDSEKKAIDGLISRMVA